MAAFLRFFLLLTPLMRRLGTCAIVGVMAGALGGYVLSVPAWFAPYHLNVREALFVTAVATLFAWLFVLFVLCVLVRMPFRTVAPPSLFNCLVTCLLTVFVARALGAYAVAWLLGMVIGALVGWSLCRLNARLKG